MQNLGMYLLLFLVAATQSFFLDNKDFKKLLQIFPKNFDGDSSKTRPTYLKRRDNDYRYRDHHVYDHHDRYDNEESPRVKTRNSKKIAYKNVNEKLHHYDSHLHCDHPDHYHRSHHHHHENRYSDDHVEQQHHKYEDKQDHPEKKYNNKDRSSIANDKDLEEKFREKTSSDKQSSLNYKKDYITGVLVAIPNLKNNENVESFYKSKQQALILQQLFKTEDDDHDQTIPEDDEKAYLY